MKSISEGFFIQKLLLPVMKSPIKVCTLEDNLYLRARFSKTVHNYNFDHNIKVFGLSMTILQLQLQLHQPHFSVIFHNVKDWNEIATVTTIKNIAYGDTN